MESSGDQGDDNDEEDSDEDGRGNLVPVIICEYRGMLDQLEYANGLTEDDLKLSFSMKVIIISQTRQIGIKII